MTILFHLKLKVDDNLERELEQLKTSQGLLGQTSQQMAEQVIMILVMMILVMMILVMILMMMILVMMIIVMMILVMMTKIKICIRSQYSHQIGKKVGMINIE